MSDRLTGDFRKYMDKSFLGAWDVPDGSDLILTIDHAAQDDVQNDRGKEKKLTLHFKEREYKPMVCNTTNAKAISKAYGSTKVENWEGKKISIYKATISAFGQTTECLRVREYAPRMDEYFCEDCNRLIEDVIVDDKLYMGKAVAENAFTKIGRRLCYKCYMKAKERSESNVKEKD